MNATFKLAAAAMAALALVFASACKKDDDKSRTDLLTQPECWSITKIEVYDATTDRWFPDQIDDCDKDDCYKFNTDGTYVFNEGLVKCNPDDPETYTGDWSLSADETELTYGVGGINLTQSIVELTEGTLVLEDEAFGFKSRTTLETN